jgi:two-component system, response regulator YesN
MVKLGTINAIEDEKGLIVTNKRLEIVVVDDEEPITEVIKTYIECIDQNINVHTFNDSVEARRFISRNKLDVLITDYKMPVCDGLQLMEAASPAVKKILVSGYISEIAEEKLHRLNATFFEKPVPLRALAKIIAEQQVAAK